MTIESRRAAGWAVALLALAGLAPAPAQNDAPTPPAEDTLGTTQAGAEDAGTKPESQFFESIDVNVVNVDVYVTDKKGERVRGLAKNDFELYEDGKPVKLTNFYAVDEGNAIEPERPVAAAKRAPSAGETAPAAGTAPPVARQPEEGDDVPEDQRLYLVVYIDNWNIKPFDRNRIFGRLRDFLRNKLSRSDRVMLMTYDREPHVRRPFTTDSATIASALFEIEKLSANGSRQDSERREVLSAIKDSEQFSQAYTRARSYAESLYNDLSFSVDSVKDLVGDLAGLPGRKAILYVSDGLEMTAGEDVFHALQEKYTDQTSVLMETHQWDLSRRFQELVASANANRISFYTIDAGGLRVSTAVSAEERSPSASAFVDQIYWGNLQGSIQMMAERTGGIAVINTNDPLKGLEVIASDFKSFYSLGYSPAHADGRLHKLEVRVAGRKELVVRHRDSFRDKSIDSRMADGVTAALTFGDESNPLGVAIELGKETPREDGHFVVAVSIKIPIGKLVLIPEGDHQAARVRLFFAAMDEKGGTSDVQQARFPIEIPTDEVAAASGKSWRYDVPMVMRAGVQRLAVGLRDELGQTSSFTVKTIRVGE